MDPELYRGMFEMSPVIVGALVGLVVLGSVIVVLWADLLHKR